MSIAKKENGWYCSVRYTDYTGKRKQHKKEGFKTKREAQEYERGFLSERTHAPKMLLRDLYAIYYKDCAARLRPTTLQSKDSMFQNHIIPFFGDLPADKITPAAVREWQNSLLHSTYAQTYIKKLCAQLSVLLNFGVRFYGLSENPVHKTGSIGRDRADAMQFYTLDQFQRFLSFEHDRAYYVLFSLLYWTGMRSGEAFALTPADFYFSRGTVRVSKSFSRLNKRDLISPPKTPKSNREITLPRSLSNLMQEYIKTLYRAPTDRIFTMSKSNAIYHLRATSSRAGLPSIRVHDLRHSHASLLIEMGYSPLLIAERLGHEKIETTLQIYSHLYPNKQDELAEKLENCYESVTHEKL